MIAKKEETLDKPTLMRKHKKEWDLLRKEHDKLNQNKKVR